MRKSRKKILVFMIMPIMVITLGGCGMMKETSNENKDSSANKSEKIVHYLAMTDMIGGIRVVDLDAEDITSKDAIVWEWTPSKEKGWSVPQDRLKLSIDDVKLRWSEYYQREVVIMTASNSWAGIADYNTGECLWENEEVPYMPHAIEMLPNGDVVIAGSGGTDYMTAGCLMYYNITAGTECTQTDLQLLSSAHGLVWDPDENVLWAVGWDHLAAYEASDEKLTRIEDKGCRLLHNNGHDLSADYYDPDQLLMSTGDRVYKFSKSENKLLIEYNFSDVLLNNVDTKGVTTFEDGTVAYCTATKVKASYDTDILNVIRLDEERGVGVQTSYRFQDFSTYKVRNFSAKYQ